MEPSKATSVNSRAEELFVRSCQKFSKQICLWILAQIIGILFIIQIVEAI